MLLNEFFKSPNKHLDFSKKNNDQDLHDKLFWYILDNDKLHKEHFFPIAKKLKDIKECGDDVVLELFMPMVKDGCREYYKENKLTGKIHKKFPLEMREELCSKLYDHYYDDIKKGKYKLG